MTPFDTFLVVDWSAADDRGPRPRKDAIWAALSPAAGGTALPPLYLGSRAAAEDWLAGTLAAEIAAGRRVLAGFDFPFGFPGGFARAVVGRTDPLALWDWFAAHLPPRGGDRFALAAAINARFPGTGPFWFNASRTDHPGLPRRRRDREGHGMAERRLAEEHAQGAFPVWQLGGAGAVGSQAMTGMAALSRLRARLGNAVRVWPFEDTEPAPVVLAEVWPSLIRAEIAGARHPGEIADAAQVRVLAAALARLQAAGGLEATLAAAPPEVRLEEGWILGLGAETALRAAARAALAEGMAGASGVPDHPEAGGPAAAAASDDPAPETAAHGPAAEVASQPAAPGSGLVPPRLRDDCFALPRGVDWMPVDTALARLCDALAPVAGVETVPITAADGRVLAEPLHALRANPPAANAAVDGYALAQGAAGGGIRRLPLLPGRAAAGHPFCGAVPAGHALRILTGAPLPEGVDTVVLEEDCATDGATVAFEGPLRVGANTRPAGEDFPAGAVLLPAGHRLRPPDLALIAAAGLGAVAVRRPLRVAVLSTGDEVSDAWGAPLPPHRIHDANRPMLMALVRRWGHAAVDLGHAPDEASAITARLDAGAASADLILTSGGASAGEEDHVSRMLRDSGQLVSWRIAMKPGRPLALALWKGVPVMGLPGNPVAAFVCALVFARPALARLSGETWAGPLALTVPAAFTKRKKAGRREYLRARLTPAGEAEVFRSEGSGRISGLSWAEGLVELPDGALEVVPGTPVRFLPYAGYGI